MTQPTAHHETAILIVTYNSAAALAPCLASAARTGAYVLVIDNASHDGSGKLAEDLGFPVIANETNRGFAAAVNQGVRATNARFLLLLNPDAVLQTGIDALIERCATGGAAAAGGQLLSPNGASQRGFTVRRFPSPAALLLEALGINRVLPGNPVNWRYRCLDQDLAKPAQVEQPAGAFLLFRRDAWARIGGFDEGFFPVWFEDVDFCKRLASAEFPIWYEPAAIARHEGAHAVAQLPLGNRTEYWYRSLLRYSIMHFHLGGRILTGFGVAIGALLRICFGGRDHRSSQMVRSYYSVIKLAFRSMAIGSLERGEPFV
jgi:GT2 family glycosyltransferase